MSALVGKIIGGVLLAGGTAFGSFNYMTTGCPLGTKSCGTDTNGAVASVDLVSASTATDAAGCCPLSGAEMVLSADTSADDCSTEACDSAKSCDTEVACDSKADCESTVVLSEVSLDSDAKAACDPSDCSVDACDTSNCDEVCADACPMAAAECTDADATVTLTETSAATESTCSGAKSECSGG
ncbi:MAG: hypothetical protein AAF356_00885 [Planctomycetota bacterium]